MNWKEFIIELLKTISVNAWIGSIIYIAWRYIDLKYFSTFDIETLKRENEWLKQENRKINGSSTEFWGENE